MVFVLGTDEAGYGPNLGPFCIGARPGSCPTTRQWTVCTNAWRPLLLAGLKSKRQAADCRLEGTLQIRRHARTARTRRADGARLPWPATRMLAEIWRHSMVRRSHRSTTALARRLQRAIAASYEFGCGSAGATFWMAAICTVKLMELQAAILFPAVFNESVKKCDNKAEVLSLTTLQLARRVLEGCRQAEQSSLRQARRPNLLRGVSSTFSQTNSS